jgi:hypothetical protein
MSCIFSFASTSIDKTRELFSLLSFIGTPGTFIGPVISKISERRPVLIQIIKSTGPIFDREVS